VIDVAPSCARMCPFDDTCPSNAADAKKWTKSAPRLLAGPHPTSARPRAPNWSHPHVGKIGTGSGRCPRGGRKVRPVADIAWTLWSLKESWFEDSVNNHHTPAFGHRQGVTDPNGCRVLERPQAIRLPTLVAAIDYSVKHRDGTLRPLSQARRVGRREVVVHAVLEP